MQWRLSSYLAMLVSVKQSALCPVGVDLIKSSTVVFRLGIVLMLRTMVLTVIKAFLTTVKTVKDL